MSEDVYIKLREFMDKLPAGFPATETGVEIKLLKKMFTPEQAELAIQLKDESEDVPTIAARTGIDESELAQKLEEMAKNGAIYRVWEGDKRLYQAYHFVIGLYEFQLKNLDREFSELFEEYMPYIGMSLASVSTSQARIIPLESSVGTDSAVTPYNQVRELVKKQEYISVQQCICRKEQGLLGNECDRPQEVCLGFGDFARFYIDNEFGRQISADEAFKVLDVAEEAALVLNTSNSQKMEFICCCCPCCCPILKGAKMMPSPSDMISSYYLARIDPDLCSACGTCIDRCQMDAISEGDDVSEIIDGRCIGCGLCVDTCPEEAISMVAKPGMEAPPKDFRETMDRIKTERGVVPV